MIKKDILELSLDSLWEDAFFYTDYDIDDAGHSITIETDKKEDFLDAFAAEFRKRAEALLEHPEIED